MTARADLADGTGYIHFRYLDNAKSHVCTTESVAAVVDDAAAIRVASAWPQLPKLRTKGSEPNTKPDDRREAEVMVRRCWRLVRWSNDELAALSGVDVLTTVRRVQQLRGQYLIFPDGTLAPAMQAAVKARIAQVVKRR